MAAVAFSAATHYMTTRPPFPGEIVACRFVVVDPEGRQMASIQNGPQGATCTFFDKEGRVPLSLGMRDEMPFIQLRDFDTNTRLSIAKSDKSLGVLLFDPEEKCRGQVLVNATGAIFGVLDRSATPRAFMICDGFPKISTLDEQAKTVWTAPHVVP
ncbi:MAG: hypothetical protein KF745_08740 [Phycisphaeraceae bacterium]|nr:hypothetical protein [Phycisphaeraceae bacterium]